MVTAPLTFLDVHLCNSSGFCRLFRFNPPFRSASLPFTFALLFHPVFIDAFSPFSRLLQRFYRPSSTCHGFCDFERRLFSGFRRPLTRFATRFSTFFFNLHCLFSHLDFTHNNITRRFTKLTRLPHPPHLSSSTETGWDEDVRRKA